MPLHVNRSLPKSDDCPVTDSAPTSVSSVWSNVSFRPTRWPSRCCKDGYLLIAGSWHRTLCSRFGWEKPRTHLETFPMHYSCRDPMYFLIFSLSLNFWCARNCLVFGVGWYSYTGLMCDCVIKAPIGTAGDHWIYFDSTTIIADSSR